MGRFRTVAAPSPRMQGVAINAARRQAASDAAATAEVVETAISDATGALDAQLAAIEERVNELENPTP